MEIKRYDAYPSHSLYKPYDVDFVEDKVGDWVRYDDIKHVLKNIKSFCNHKNTKQEIELNAYPYGDTIKKLVCTDCGRILNVKTY